MYYIGSYSYDPDYLAHHGIKGQKWGVRRYQNEDGTWTAAGKKRYGDDTKAFLTAQEGNIKRSEKSARKHLKKAERTHNAAKAEEHRRLAEQAKGHAEQARKRLSTFEKMSTEDRQKVLSAGAQREKESRREFNKKSWGAAAISTLVIPAWGAVKMAKAYSKRASDIFNPYKNFGSQEMDAYISDLERKQK